MPFCSIIFDVQNRFILPCVHWYSSCTRFQQYEENKTNRKSSQPKITLWKKNNINIFIFYIKFGGALDSIRYDRLENQVQTSF